MKLPILTALAMTAVAFIAAPVAAQTPEDVRQRVTKWVEQLDSSDFDVREHATQRLVAAGAPAIKPLEAAIASQGSLEVITRGLQVLRQIITSLPETKRTDKAPADPRQLALEALDRLAKSPSPLIARQAANARVVVRSTEEEKAMRTLRVLGAQVTQGSEYETNAPIYLVLGSKWRGGPGDLRHVAKLPRLISLSVKRAKVTVDDFSVLREIPSLQYLDLMYVNMGDDVIQHLVPLKSLQFVRLYGTRITPEGKTELERSMLSRGVGRNLGTFNSPVDYKQGAFLGVHCQPSPAPCMIRDVTPDSAAHSADLRPGDVIFSYDQKPVQTFDDLRTLIGQNRAGDSKTLKVLRPGETINKVQKLTSDDQLGIEAEASPIGAKIAKVLPESVAAKLELKAGDIITSYNGNGVPDFAELKALFEMQMRALKRREAGEPEPPKADPFGFRRPAFIDDNCSIIFVRDVEELEKTVKFGEWE
ncbi:MAG TPA: hypothetical protein DCY79_17035 [Planctomycetaceae bacterium]|nr:hypothetical protein [Planctomycetaceae bacterium]